MNKLNQFDQNELEILDNAAFFAEELVNNFFKMSSAQWLRNRYDIKTAKDLSPHELVQGPFAQVVKYEGKKKKGSLGSSGYTYYAICIQDSAILKTVSFNNQLKLYPFLLYILIHELVHVVRFGKFLQIFENVAESDVSREEEHIVHQLTYKILSTVSLDGLDIVLKYHEKWRLVL